MFVFVSAGVSKMLQMMQHLCRSSGEDQRQASNIAAPAPAPAPARIPIRTHLHTSSRSQRRGWQEADFKIVVSLVFRTLFKKARKLLATLQALGFFAGGHDADGRGLCVLPPLQADLHVGHDGVHGRSPAFSHLATLWGVEGKEEGGGVGGGDAGGLHGTQSPSE